MVEDLLIYFNTSIKIMFYLPPFCGKSHWLHHMLKNQINKYTHIIPSMRGLLPSFKEFWIGKIMEKFFSYTLV